MAAQLSARKNVVLGNTAQRFQDHPPHHCGIKHLIKQPQRAVFPLFAAWLLESLSTLVAVGRRFGKNK